MISLEKMQTVAPDLVKRYEIAKTAFGGLKAAVYLAIDVSGSMYQMFQDGTVQELAERVLGASAALDDDGIVPVFFFNTGVRNLEHIVIGQHQGFMNQIASPFGGTKFSPVMDAIVSYHLDNQIKDPALVFLQTDGDQDDIRQTNRSLVSSSELPIYWQFVGMGKKTFPRLEHLDTMQGRVVDNAELMIDRCLRDQYGRLRSSLTDQEIYNDTASGYRRWLANAQRMGIVR